jgi:hypothetical protein
MPRLASHVHATSPTGEVVVLPPGEDVPDWALVAVRNPKAWEGGEAPEVKAPAHAAPPTPGVPPKNGPGSGIDAWKAYAETKNVQVGADDKREDIIAALDRAGVPTE